MSVRQYVGRRTLIVMGVAAICMVIAAASGGCYAYRRSAPLSAEQQRALNEAPLPYTVSVVPWNSDPGENSGRDPNAYAKSLADLVANSRAFRASRLEAQPGSDADLVAVSTGLHCNTAIVPLFTILTVGMIPTVFEDEDCDGLVIRSAKASTAQPLEIGVRNKGQVVMGWAAVVIGALPGWSYGSARNDERYGERLRLELLRNRNEIDALVKQVR